MHKHITPEDKRRENDYRRLRTRNPICLYCGYHNHPAAMELAHIARANSMTMRAFSVRTATGK
jgi:5-methylcytosine-specific restriction endonuclease McrA